MAVSSKGQKIPDWGKRPRGGRSGSAPRLIKRLPGDAATTVFTDWFLDANATSGVTLAMATTTGPAVMVANLKTKAILTAGTTTGPATLTANVTVTGLAPVLLSLGTTTGPAVFAANITVSGGGPSSLTLSTTTGQATFYCAVTTGAVPDVVYLRVAAQDRRMGINYVRFPIVIPFKTRAMQVQVSRLTMQVLASPRLMRVA